MSKDTYIYFGSDLFNKLHEIVDEDDNSWILSNFDKFRIFSSLKMTKLTIKKIHLGWSYAVFEFEDAFYHVGFPNLKGQPSQVFEIENFKDIAITCCMNKIYAFTNNKLYLYSTENMQPIVIDLFEDNQKIQKISAEDLHIFIVIHGGAVYSVNIEKKPTLIPLPFTHPIVQVVCGKEHTLFLSCSGQVFSFGNGSRGQLGHGTIDSYDKPTLLEALDGIEMKVIACGGWHSAAISVTGDLYMWGWNESGQLGFPCAQLHGDTLPLSEIETVCYLPKIVEFNDDKQIISVSCGTRHTGVLTEDSEVWTWGWNEYGQLGHGAYAICDKPCKILFSSKFIPKRIECAFWSTLIWGSLVEENVK